MNEMVERMSDSLDYQVIKARTAWQKRKEKANEVLCSEAGAVDIVVILLLVVVAIVLVVVFRNELSAFIKNIFKQLNGAVDTAPTGMDQNQKY